MYKKQRTAGEKCTSQGLTMVLFSCIYRASSWPCPAVPSWPVSTYKHSYKFGHSPLSIADRHLWHRTLPP